MFPVLMNTQNANYSYIFYCEALDMGHAYCSDYQTDFF